MTSSEDRDVYRVALIHYINKTVSIINPHVQVDGSDIDSAPQLKTNGYMGNKAYTDSLYNPPVQVDASDIDSAPQLKTNRYMGNKAYTDVVDFSENLSDLVGTC